MLSQASSPSHVHSLVDLTAFSQNRKKIHQQIQNYIANSSSHTISPSLLFKIFQQHCDDKMLLERLSEFNCAGFSFNFSQEEALSFVDQLLDFSLSFCESQESLSQSESHSKSEANENPNSSSSSFEDDKSSKNAPQSSSSPFSLQIQLEKQAEIISRLNQDIFTLKSALSEAQKNLQIMTEREKGYLDEINQLNDKILTPSSSEVSISNANEDHLIQTKLSVLSSSLQQRQMYINELSSLLEKLKENPKFTLPSGFEAFLSRAKNVFEQDKAHSEKIQTIASFLIKKNQQLVDANKHFVVNLHGIKNKLEQQDSKEKGLKSLCVFLYNALMNPDAHHPEKQPISTNQVFQSSRHWRIVYVFFLLLPVFLYMLHLSFQYGKFLAQSGVEFIS